MYDYVIVGGGIVGLATASVLTARSPRARILVLEKETKFAQHQSAHNSGVIHSGIYYKPGSLKATLAQSGNSSMREFCERHGVAFKICGKIIVATEDRELPLLDALYQRAIENNVPVTKLTREQVNEYEPHVACVAGVRVHSTGITNYSDVCRALTCDLQRTGVELRVATEMLQSVPTGQGYQLETASGSVRTRFLITCAGLHSDRVSTRSGWRPEARIIPFRGEFYELKQERCHLVNGLIYPVPNPNFPFLGVHLTRMIDSSVHAGPNAVLALQREGYSRTSFAFKDTLDTLTYPGFWKLAARYCREGLEEILRSASKALFARSLQRLVPEIESDDLVPIHAGVRAQALMADGSLVDDFLIQQGKRSLFVLNAPSPAATASLEIAKHIAAMVPELESITVAMAAKVSLSTA